MGETGKPWEAEGISKATWYRRQAKGAASAPERPVVSAAPAEDETLVGKLRCDLLLARQREDRLMAELAAAREQIALLARGEPVQPGIRGHLGSAADTRAWNRERQAELGGLLKKKGRKGLEDEC